MKLRRYHLGLRTEKSFLARRQGSHVRLRSTVAAHRSQDLRRRLSPVDVHNVQMVARRLLMESFGEWRRTD